ncbi:hypothetical protein E4O00_07360 [Treponema sp. OMZ 788]|uniref:hypothetical protein n=1 Tax=Treponema sp. OMZ 788 TaxID=2563664 RepID=UPI0020A5C25E|nr:hypothetical protein [Treponema sp. OMZ 788]UTC63757.1 hypothetical protein E4O00_07360 [Treponema sp. OMZ 788]
MYKKLVVVILMCLPLTSYAFELSSYWSLGDVKLGGLFQTQKPKAAFNLNISAFKFYFKDLDSGFNLSLNPFYMDIKGDNKEIEKVNGESVKGSAFFKQGLFIMSLVNAELSYNTLNYISDSLELNLFTSIHAADPVTISRFQINAGLEFAITKEIYPFAGRKYPLKSKLVSARTGFRYADRKPLFFCDIGFNLGSLLFIFKGDYEKAKEKAQKETVKDVFDRE